VGKDGKNSVVFVTSNWEATMLGSSDALAVTSVWKDPSGKIVEADVAINADPLTMPNPLANLDPGVAPPLHGQARVDLQTLMTHEFGHFLGLAHPCVLDSATGVGSDDNGDEPTGVASCTGAASTVVEAVMYPIIDSESIAKRVLTADDAAGVCAIYPPSADPPSCTENTPDDGCGCRTVGPGRGAALAAVVAAMALVLPGGRRRRRRR
jgi:MYXO-CTERM domain-containing protein